MDLRELKSRSIEVGSDLGHRISDQWQRDSAARRASINVGRSDRIISGILGSTLLLLGMRRPGAANRLVSLAGADLLIIAACGHCNIYKALNISTASPKERTSDKRSQEPRLARRPAA